MNELALTKLDVLDDFETIKLCTHYIKDGNETHIFPLDADDVSELKPVYKTFPGWNRSTRDISSFSDLPEKAQEYIHFIEDFIGVKFTIVSTGPKRTETIIR
jgi:adenylosuccinate synthase